MRTSLLLTLLSCGYANGAPTLEEARLALEGLESAWVTLRFEFVQLPLGVATGALDHPDRIQGWCLLSSEGGYAIQQVNYKQGRPGFAFELWWDGKKLIPVAHVLKDGNQPGPRSIRQASMQSASPKVRYLLADCLSLKYGDVMYSEYLSRPDAAAGGEIEVDGHACWRFTSVLPIGVKNNSRPKRLILDLDPTIDFWPRHIRTEDLDSDAAPDKYQAFHFDSFDTVDGNWYPKTMTTDFSGRRTGYFVTSYLPSDLPQSFTPDLPDGTNIYDERTRKTSIVGGNSAATALRKEMVAKSQDFKSKNQGVSAIRTTNNWGYATLLFVMGLGILTLAIYLRYRKK